MPWPLISGVAAGWMLVALTSLGAKLWTDGGPQWRTIPKGQFLAAELLSLVTWVLLSLLGLVLIRRVVRHRSTPARRLLTAVILGTVLAVLFAALEHVLMRAVAPARDAATLVAFLPDLDLRIIAFLAMVGLVYKSARASRSPDEAARVPGSASRSDQMDVQPLITQLQAHFLYNTLNDAAELVHTDPDAADDIIARLGEFLRGTLVHAGEEFAPFGQELDFIRAYTAIQAVRLRDRLAIVWDLAPDIKEAKVPVFLWQPILENAFRYGADPACGRVEIEIGARRDGTDLVLWVRDRGRGLAESRSAAGQGIGLTNTRDRLSRLYGASGSLQLQIDERGALAMIRLPFSVYPVGAPTRRP